MPELVSGNLVCCVMITDANGPVPTSCSSNVALTAVLPGECNRRSDRRLHRSAAYDTAAVSCKVSDVSVEIATDTNETSGTSSPVAAVFSETAANIQEDNPVNICPTSTAVVKRKRGRPPKVIVLRIY